LKVIGRNPDASNENVVIIILTIINHFERLYYILPKLIGCGEYPKQGTCYEFMIYNFKGGT